MERLERIVGQAAALELLRATLRRGRVPHALLFHGPAGVGKATTAGLFAAALICEGDADEACGDCPSCDLLDADAHPDLLRVGRLTQSEVKKDRDKSRLRSANPDARLEDLGSWIVVEQIRKLNQLVGLSPRQGRRRVFLVDPADRMNAQAQNALLKTLEEPPPRAVILLVAARPHLLLPTVRSRCFGVGFSPLRTSELARLLEQRGMAPDEAAARAALAAGSLGHALELDLDVWRERRDELVDLLLALAAGRGGLERLTPMAAALAGKNEATLLDGLELLEGLLRDAARAGTGGRPEVLVNADIAEAVGRLGRRLGPARAASLVGGVERARGYLRYNANRVLLAETLLAAVAGGPLP